MAPPQAAQLLKNSTQPYQNHTNQGVITPCKKHSADRVKEGFRGMIAVKIIIFYNLFYFFQTNNFSNTSKHDSTWEQSEKLALLPSSDQSMFTIKPTLKGYDTSMEHPLARFGNISLKTTSNSLFPCQFGWCLQDKKANQQNWVILLCTNIELLIWYCTQSCQRNRKPFDIVLREMFLNLANRCSNEVSFFGGVFDSKHWHTTAVIIPVF